MIYLLYHFPTRKAYVGQTRLTIVERARKHWWEAKRLPDELHRAIARTPSSPYDFVLLPLERVEPRLWKGQPQGARVFRRVAEARERFWDLHPAHHDTGRLEQCLAR